MANSFSLDVKNFADSFIDGSEQVVRGTTIKLFTAIIKSTPVDEGRARANWFTTGQKPSDRKTNKKDEQGASSINEVNRVVVGIKDWSKFTLTNNLPYIEVLEFGGYNEGPKTINGYSRQAPNGMVRVNIARFNKLLEQEAKKALPK